MSWRATTDAAAESGSTCDPVDLVIDPRAKDLGGFEVRRVLPSSRRRLVGPFIFFDQMGPARFGPGQGIDVRSHPHIGLATVTYLFDGEILHRDSLGSEQLIRPGELNWMNAGRGIVHSERTDPVLREAGGPMFGIQAWVALPTAEEDSEPTFQHVAADDLPVIAESGVWMRLIAGRFNGTMAPTRTKSDLFYLEARLQAGAHLPVDTEHAERCIYVVSGAISIAGTQFEASRMVILKPGHAVTVTADSPSRLMIAGGAPLDGARHIWWNFVSSDPARIEQAKADWAAGRFPAVPGDDKDFIPLPESV